MGFGLVIGFIDCNSRNYGAIANSHTLKFTAARTKPFQFAVFTSCLITVFNAVDPSAFVLTSLYVCMYV
jgi:hypothetical protein